jgi:hypothetical protein
MSRIEELKKQNPSFNVDGIEIINQLLGKPKYTEMAINLIKYKNLQLSEGRSRDTIEELKNGFGFDVEYLNSLNYLELSSIMHLISDYFGYNNFKLLKEFINLNEKKLIENNDLTTYKTFDELELQISLSSLKTIDKEMAKQVLKLYETDEWLIVKPLSYQASLKYGASTKWCTASKDSPDYYFRYSRRGILIYCINKKTGNKVGAFKNLDTGYDVETSFWNITDQRIDSMESGLPNDVLDVIRYDFFNTKESNWDILSDEERNRQLLWFENEYRMKKVSNDYDGPVGEVEVPMNETIPIRNIRRRLTPLRRVTIDAEAELTRLLEEEIMEESVRDMSEYSDDDYIDQAG